MPSSVKETLISPDLWSSSLRALIDSFHLDERGYLQVAWSFGGIITRNYLLAHGKGGMRGLMLIGSHLDFLAATKPGPTKESVQAAMQVLERMGAGEPYALYQFVQMLSKKTFSVEQFNILFGYNARALLRLLSFGITPMDVLTTQRDGDWQEVLAVLPPAVHIVQGAHDALVPREIGEHLHTALPQSQLQIFHASTHSPFEEEAERFNTTLKNFAHMVLGQQVTLPAA